MEVLRGAVVCGSWVAFGTRTARTLFWSVSCAWLISRLLLLSSDRLSGSNTRSLDHYGVPLVCDLLVALRVCGSGSRTGTLFAQSPGVTIVGV
jgi:hypothetical protein